jgi:hypothetical protein
MSVQSRSLAERLQSNSKLQAIQTLLAKFIAEDFTVEGRLDLKSKKALKLTIDSLVENAWSTAESQTFGPKSQVAKVPQIHLSHEIDTSSSERKNLMSSMSNRTARSRRTLSNIEVKHLSYTPSVQCLSPSASARNRSIYSNFNSSLMSRSQTEALSLSGFCSVVGAASFGASKRKLTEENLNSPGPSAYTGDRLSLRQKSPRTVFAKGSPKKYYELGTKTPGPSAYYPIPQAASKRR